MRRESFSPRTALSSSPPDGLLLSVTQIGAYLDQQLLTRASGFFFCRDERLYLVTSRHVMFDRKTGHYPNRLEIELHVDPQDLTRSSVFLIPLYSHGQGIWHQGSDAAGDIDVAVIELDQEALPHPVLLCAFTPQHLAARLSDIGVGDAVSIVGFPLGFHDTRHHLPVVRQAAIASAFGVRFQGQGLFLTDARTHRGSSGAPVVMHALEAQMTSASAAVLPWRLLGIHSSRFDMSSRDQQLDETLGLNCAWYADILMTLTDAPPNPITPTLRPAAQPELRCATVVS